MFRKFLAPLHKKVLSSHDSNYHQTFDELVQRLSIDELRHSAMYYQLDFDEETSRQTLIEMLSERFHKKGNLYYELLIQEEILDIQLLADALSVNHNIIHLSPKDFEQMVTALIIFDIDKKLVIPEDTKQALMKLPLDEIEQKKDKYEQDFTFISSNLMLYGFVTREHLEEHYRKTYQDAFETDSINLFLSIYDLQIHDGYIVDGLLDSWIEDKEAFQELQQFPYYEFKDSQEVYDFVGPDHHLQTPQMKNLAKFLKKEAQLSPDEWDHLIEGIQVYTMGAPDFESADHEIGLLIKGQLSREDREQFDTLYKDLFQHTRQWVLGGHTPSEIEQMELDREAVKRSIKMNKVVAFNDIKAIKKD
ncbi:hypothetical protein [Macrococcus brunensis]|uniref:hypothetical protein n=1 Tax=Macrococcus brunensis TaxID=198483 RepID=UPI001EEFAEC8|nr:hypothetical protein [Macrococcus brunensis]ULG74322.1 hypothetical protein MGG13_00690 [Macrococcus brunensis]